MYPTSLKIVALIGSLWWSKSSVDVQLQGVRWRNGRGMQMNGIEQGKERKQQSRLSTIAVMVYLRKAGAAMLRLSAVLPLFVHLVIYSLTYFT